MARILVVEDDPETAAQIVSKLVENCHDVLHLGNGREALARAHEERFDAMTLDRMLPGMNGLELVSRLRAEQITTPVLMISAMGDVDERIEGLRAGGDEYPPEGILHVGSLDIDLIKRKVWLAGEPVQLLQKEFRLLEFLARHQGKIIDRRLIFEQVWGCFFDPSDNLINVHIGKLRRKLERPGRPSPIQTIKGEGYRLVED